MTVKNAALKFRVTPATIYRWIRIKKLKGEKVRGRWRIDIPNRPKADAVTLSTVPPVRPKAAVNKNIPWHPQVRRRDAELAGLSAEDFLFEQWRISNIKLELSTTRGGAFDVYCKIPKDTPLCNQYIYKEDGSYEKIPNPVNSMCLLHIKIILVNSANGEKLDKDLREHKDGQVRGWLGKRRRRIWKVLTPGKSVDVKVYAQPFFSYMNEHGHPESYTNRGDGYFAGNLVTSREYRLSLDEDSNLSLESL